jgi:hypothetical protein
MVDPYGSFIDMTKRPVGRRQCLERFGSKLGWIALHAEQCFNLSEEWNFHRSLII